MEECRNAIKEAQRISAENSQASKNYSDETAARNARESAHIKEETYQYNAREKVRNEWNDRFNNARNKEHVHNCDDQNCWSGWEEKRKESCGHLGWGRKVICRPNEATAKAEANAGGREQAEYHKKPFSDPVITRPIMKPLPNIACCSNETNIIGSTLTDTDINQMNSCVKELEVEEKAENVKAENEEAERLAEIERKKILAENPQPIINYTEKGIIENVNDKKKYVAIAIAVFICCICSLSSISVVILSL